MLRKRIGFNSIRLNLIMLCMFLSCQCWETRVGQEMYKLTLFDLLINIAVLVLVEFPRRYRFDLY